MPMSGCLYMQATHTCIFTRPISRKHIKRYLLIYTAPLLSNDIAAPYNAFLCGILT